MKHAYLIMAHKNWGQLQILMKMLDDKRTDIYLHIDKRSNISDSLIKELYSSLRYSQLYLIESSAINWGGYSIVNTTIQLLKAATHYGYDYYHLLSGMDLPLKTQDEIDAFFKQNKGFEFLLYVTSGPWLDSIRKRYQYYWICNECSRRNTNRVWHKVNQLNILFQRFFRVNRLKARKIAAGSQWFSITHPFARKICEHEDWIRKCYRNTFIPDESFIGTLAETLGNELCVFRLPPGSKCTSSMRLIDWDRGKPYVWRLKDYDELMDSGCLFARKFDETVDNEIILKIYEKLKRLENEK